MSRSDVLNFAETLSQFIPEGLTPGERAELWLNIVLVYAGARPSTLLEHLPQEQLLGPFMEYIQSVPRLRMDTFATEGAHADFWIYNIRYSYLFCDRNISHMPEVQIQNIWGLRLGVPCSGEFFFNAVDEGWLILSVEMRVGEKLFYAYYCPITESHMIDAVTKWGLFDSIARAIGLHTTLTLQTKVP